MKYTEFTGKTVDEAVETGLKELGITKEQADIRVLEEGKKKLFGSVKARVEIACLEESCACESVCEKKEEQKVESGNATDGERTVEFLDGLFKILNITACTELVEAGLYTAGEASAADCGIAGGIGEGVLFKKGQIIKKVPQDQLVDELFALIDTL